MNITPISNVNFNGKFRNTPVLEKLMHASSDNTLSRFNEVVERDFLNAFSGRLDAVIEYTGRSCKAEITYKTKGGYGLKNNWCALGLKLIK